MCCALAFAGCAGDDEGERTDGTAATVDDGTAGDDGATGSMSGPSSVSDTGTGSVGDDGSGSDDAPGESTGPSEPQPNGSECTENEQCVSGFCFVIQVLGGLCGECLVDADCPDGGGCSLPNPLAMPPVGAVCNDGEAGEGCMTDDVCQDPLVCATILEVPGILTAATCSECTMDSDCTDGMLCSPSYDVLNISGQKTCVMPMSVPNGEGCDFAGTGDMACMSEICAAVNVNNLLMVGVCGECEVDADCMAPDTCQPAALDMDTGVVTPPLCGMGM
ncbi:MAG TPA: hypothetical protein VFG69_20945 [Nannocystaceae bacterium]|nr:hypothetical protein [Nannocystaceae bacterium]